MSCCRAQGADCGRSLTQVLLTVIINALILQVVLQVSRQLSMVRAAEPLQALHGPLQRPVIIILVCWVNLFDHEACLGFWGLSSSQPC